MLQILESIIEATLYIVKFADISNAIFSIMANALRCDFYWRLSHVFVGMDIWVWISFAYPRFYARKELNDKQSIAETIAFIMHAFLPMPCGHVLQCALVEQSDIHIYT